MLGSQSPRRFEILREIVPPEIAVEVMPTGLNEEIVQRPIAPEKLSLRLATMKSEALRKLVIERAILVTADTVTVADNQLLREKPKNKEQARNWLRSYTIRCPLRVITSVVLVSTWNQRTFSSVESAVVEFNGFPERAIDAIIADGTALGCAGAVMSEHPLFVPHIRKIRGESSTVQGLPRSFVKRTISALLV